MYQVNGATGNPALKTQNDVQPIGNITDGTSTTVLIHENAGRPDYYILGVKQPTTTGMTNPVWWGAWASYQHFTYQSYNAAGTAAGWACTINCNNSQGTYSFHPDGAQLAFCDGSVRFVSTSVDAHLFFALLTRNGGEDHPRKQLLIRDCAAEVLLETLVKSLVKNRWLTWWLLAVLLSGAGCGGRDKGLPKVQPVAGTVFVAGRPAAGAEITFHSQSAAAKKVQPFAIADPSGAFRPTTFLDGDEAPAGEYVITVIWPTVKEEGGETVKGPDRLKGRYNNPQNTPLKVVIREGTNELPPIQLSVR